MIPHMLRKNFAIDQIGNPAYAGVFIGGAALSVGWAALGYCPGISPCCCRVRTP